MVSEGLIKELAALVPLREQEPMDKHVSFRAGGAARAFVTVPDEEMLCRVLKLLEADGADWFLLGRGSNLLVGDGGFDGVVIRPGEGFEELSVQGESLHAGAAVSLNRLASLAAEQS
ncbi:MAG: FAD-binding protein, partial [Lachnospiraceae bacterium]|nr:FAD-binding protein [Lachnospiraceae bacterium]